MGTRTDHGTEPLTTKVNVNHAAGHKQPHS